MELLFGVVEKYVSDRGFGFVTNEFPDGRRESYFFHIKSVKKARPELVADLESGKGASFWYILEESQKGKQALPLDKRQWDANKQHADRLVGRIEQIWAHSAVLPTWLDGVTVELLGVELREQLVQEREQVESERRRIADEHLKISEAKRLGRIAQEEADRAKRLADEEARRAISAAEETAKRKEFDALVAEIAAYGFTRSSDVSRYIVKNKLGYKYKKISGYITMELDGRQWEFKGGFPPDVYAQLCDALGLGNNGSASKVVYFESFENHKNRSGFY